jgi:hypothetical protein
MSGCEGNATPFVSPGGGALQAPHRSERWPEKRTGAFPGGAHPYPRFVPKGAEEAVDRDQDPADRATLLLEDAEKVMLHS